MKTMLERGCSRGRLMGLMAMVALAGAVLSAQAQTVRILYRPLTPQELKNYGLTNTTQKSSGSPNVGLGQPVYAEALITTGTVVTAVNWSLIGAPAGSAAVMLPSPLSNQVPTYDGGDRIGLFVASRAVLKPDVLSSYDFGTGTIIDYKIKTDIVLTNKTLSFTNSAFGCQYLGQKHYLCVLCHADKQANFDQTAHATAFTRKINGEGVTSFGQNCIGCHALGYDTTAGATNSGFDDVATQLGWTMPTTLSPTNWASMPSNLQVKANVQCESCHGPASTHMLSLGKTNAIDISLSAGTCGVCHDSITKHVKNYEWGNSLHSTGYVFRFSGSCMPCHSTRGFIETWDPFYAPSNKVPRSTEQEGIGCAACHDPHTKGMGEHQLRNIPTATLSNGVVVTEAVAGDGVLCMNCHHARNSANIVVSNLTSSSISPHHGTQGDLLLGENGYEYGLNMPSSRHLLAVTNSCVGCHMQLVAGTSYSNLFTKVGGHTFKLIYQDASTNINVTEVCSKCHVEKGTFDIAAEDYNRDGTIQGVQTEIRSLLDQLALLLPPVGSTQITVTTSYTLSQRAAAWNQIFISEDKSLGIHNPKYAAALLQASIDDLSGGIDVDRDGLRDSWEMAKFGNLLSQKGSGDADGDGVSNALEEDAGTNPNTGDTDNDGVSDLAELQGGTNPLDFNSVLATNVLTMFPALELGYLPGAAGSTQVFQSINVLGDGGGWTNVGAPTVSSNSASYQLMSLRDSTNKFFRVIKP